MFSIGLLTAINLVVLLAPSKLVILMLELMILPFEGRTLLLWVVVVNVVLSMMYEKWGVGAVARVVGWVIRLRGGKRRAGYQRVEG